MDLLVLMQPWARLWCQAMLEAVLTTMEMFELAQD